MSAPSIREYLEDKSNVLLIDGALATELEKLGCNLNDPLWSAKVLLEEPGKIEEVQRAYLRAGAQCLITASYQGTPQALMERRGLSEEEAVAVVRRSADLARAARDAHLRECPGATVFVAGSVGPYGAHLANGSEYTGAYSLSAAEYKDFHRPRIAALVAAGVDLLAVETQPKAEEVLAVVALVAEEFPQTPVWIALAARLADDGTPTLGDGGDIAALVRQLDGAAPVIAVGVNCLPKDTATAALAAMQPHTSLPLVVYPNSGEVYDPVTKTWSACPTGEAWASYWAKWQPLGVRLVGGCCRTGPADIEELRALVKKP